VRRTATFLSFLVAFVAVAGCQSLALKTVAEQAYYPGKLRIERQKNLSAQEREIEARLAAYLEESIDQAIALYQAKFGKEINTDNARELSKDYAPGGIEAMDSKTIAARTTWSTAVYKPASALVGEIYRRELKKPAGAGQLDWVVFTAGGSGSGKTTIIRQAAEVVSAIQQAQIIYDTTLSSGRSAEQINSALQAGKTVSIMYVHRDPVDSLVNGALPRAELDGRIVSLEAFIETHLGSAKLILEIADRYKDDPRVAISVIDNSREMGNASVADFKIVRQNVLKYTAGELRVKLIRELEVAYEKGKRGEKGGVSEAVYRGFKGNVFERVYGSVNPGDGKEP